MVSCYNLIGKQVLSLVSGQIVGIVKNIELVNMKLTKILAFNDNSEIGEEFLFDAKNVFCFGENAITLKKEDFEISCDLTLPKIVGANLYNQEGTKLDTIVDITIDPKSFKVNELIGETQVYSPSQIFSLNNGVVVLKGNAKVIKSKPIEKIKVNKPSNVKILNNDIVVDKSIILENTNLQENSIPTSPQKTLANFTFLVGRVIVKTTYVNNGKTVLNAGQIVDQKIIQNAFQNNFLKDLLECSKSV